MVVKRTNIRRICSKHRTPFDQCNYILSCEKPADVRYSETTLVSKNDHLNDAPAKYSPTCEKNVVVIT